jgi:pyruvate formate lyase activating enzyme
MENNHNDPAGLIFKIKRFSVHDGPGIRTTVFLKGCPLNCVWCHSPEGISPDITIWHDKNSCIACGQCVDICPSKALRLSKTGAENIIEINRELCNLSGNCAHICPAGAIRFTGSVISVSELLSEIEKDTIFYENSGGGVTLSGGEALHQPEFTTAILKACKEKNIHTAIETCLYADKEVINAISCYTDLFIIDLKLFDPTDNRHFTGQSNEVILENFLYLASTGKEMVVRIPLVPGITDTRENLDSIEKFVSSSGRDIPVEYIDYNPLARNNYDKLGLSFPMDEIKPLNVR